MGIMIGKGGNVTLDPFNLSGQKIKVFAGPDRNLNPCFGRQFPAPETRAESNRITTDFTLFGDHPTNFLIFGHYAGNRSFFKDPCSPGFCTLNQSGAQVGRTDTSIIR